MTWCDYLDYISKTTVIFYLKKSVILALHQTNEIMKTFAKIFAALLLVGVGSYVYQTLPSNLHPTARAKYEYLKEVLVKRGYEPNVFICSAKRPKWINTIVPNAASSSRHMRGHAVDVYVLDVDGDWDMDRKDMDIVYRALHDIDVWHPRFRGGLGTYHNDPFFTARRTIHTDVRFNGSMPRWHH